jgi:hypothetical protein
VLLYVVLSSPIILNAQTKAPKVKKKPTVPFVPGPLFKSDSILNFKLIGKLSSLFNDRGDNAVSHPILLQYKANDSTVPVNLMVRTRGYFRRDKSMCKLPPLMLNFLKSNKLKNTVFQKQNKLKLVVPCQGDDYVIREYLIYKLYNLISPRSFKARLAQVEFEDSLGKRKPETHYCFLLEDDKEVAKRNNGFIWEQTMVPMTNTDRAEFKKITVFQYMICNEESTVNDGQNIKLLKIDSTKAPYTIPYDFDHAGIVDAPYALPAEELEMSSVQERRYRGFCEPDKTAFAETFALFNSLKNDFYNVYTSCTLLDAKYVKFVTRYLDDFFKIINSDKQIDDSFGHPCRQEQRIEIKGLKER